jgi:predicted ABC-type ATPase
MLLPPNFVIIAGPNGSGKSTSAPAVLPTEIPYINADEIAKNLPDDPERNRDIRASRILLDEMDRLEAARADFAIETTLASRSLAPRAVRLQAAGYRFHLLFFWVAAPELSIARVAERVRMGGHHIPEPVIRRRYTAGIRNFLTLYQPIADTWRVYDNTRVADTRPIAEGTREAVSHVYAPETWAQIKQGANQDE